MRKVIIFFFILLFWIIPTKTNAQMMQQSTVTPSQQDIRDIKTGESLYIKFQNGQISCEKLTNDDFEKIGEYLMNQHFGGNTGIHLQMNRVMKQMMGENGEEQMHISLARNVTNCTVSAGGGGTKMNWGYSNMMGWSGSWIILPLLIQVIILIDLLLVGVWLWKKIRK